jgi:hypothetical protein
LRFPSVHAESPAIASRVIMPPGDAYPRGLVLSPRGPPDEWPDDCGGDVRKAEIRIFDKVGVRTRVVGVTLSDTRDDRRNGA